MKHLDTAFSILGVISFVIAICFWLYGCGGPSFAYIPAIDLPDASDAAILSDTMDVRDASGDSSNPDSTKDAVVSDTMVVDVVQEDVVITDTGAEADASSDATDAGQDSGCTPLHHSNGLGQIYLDCVPLGTEGNASTYSQTMAQEAATVWIKTFDTGAPTQGVDPNCNGGTSTCWAVTMWPQGIGYVWCFTGGLAGFVGSGACPTNGDATWN